MSTPRMIELFAAVVILGVSVWLYRHNKPVDRGYGSQGAVLLLVIGAIMAIHAIGLLEYRPSASELEAAQARAR
jgi:hypothetical protein